MNRRDLLLRVMSTANRAVYRVSGGRLAGRMGRAPILLLTVTGRRSGKRRTLPLLYLRDGERLAVVASKGGDPRHPSWFLNLRDDPDVEIEIGRDRRRLRARVATPEERELLWPRLVEIYPPYAVYQTRTSRVIPVVVLE